MKSKVLKYWDDRLPMDAVLPEGFLKRPEVMELDRKLVQMDKGELSAVEVFQALPNMMRTLPPDLLDNITFYVGRGVMMRVPSRVWARVYPFTRKGGQDLVGDVVRLIGELNLERN